MTPQFLAAIAGLVGATVGLTTLIKAVAEYRKQGTTARSEIFLKMRSRFREDSVFKVICDLLERDDPKLCEISLVEKDRFLGFFEELALLMNSGLISHHVSAYMFGYFAVRCLQSENFWRDLNREHVLWAAFFDFASQMETEHHQFQYDRRRFRL